MNKFSKATSEKSSKKSATAKRAVKVVEKKTRKYTRKPKTAEIPNARVVELEAKLADLMKQMKVNPAPQEGLLAAMTKLNQNLGSLAVVETPVEGGWFNTLWNAAKSVAPYAAGTVLGVTMYHVASGNSPELPMADSAKRFAKVSKF